MQEEKVGREAGIDKNMGLLADTETAKSFPQRTNYTSSSSAQYPSPWLFPLKYVLTHKTGMCPLLPDSEEWRVKKKERKKNYKGKGWELGIRIHLPFSVYFAKSDFKLHSYSPSALLRVLFASSEELSSLKEGLAIQLDSSCASIRRVCMLASSQFTVINVVALPISLNMEAYLQSSLV